MKYLLTLTMAMVLFIAPAFSQTQTNHEKISKPDQLDRLMTYCNDNGMFNGTILVTENGKVIYRKALGYADLQTKEPLIPESCFYLASVSKQFTAMAVMILKESNKLSYDDKLSEYFPEFPGYADEVTIWHLLTHTSGVPDHYGLNAYKKDLKNSEVLELLVKQEALDFTPGEKYSYSNGGFVLLSMIVEKASGQPFHLFMKKNIFDPLGMKNTLVFDESKPEIKNRAKGYNSNGALDDYEILTTGAGGMYSTLDDLHLWDQALYTEKLVSKATLEEAFTPTVLNSGERSDYGFGWGISEDENGKVVSHSGGMNGYRTFIRRDLAHNNGYIWLTNNGDALANRDINNAIVNILAGKSFELPKIPFSRKLATWLKENDTETAIKQAKQFLEENPGENLADESGINSLGYAFLNAKDTETAIAVFKLNTELFPSSANVYDSLGEGYMNNDENDKAIQNYKKSIELNPNNNNAIEMLVKLGLDESELRPQIKLPADLLDSYAGKYELQPGFILEISREGERLFILPTGQSKSEIFPASTVRFYSKIVDAQITFNKDEKGKVVSLTLHQGGDFEAPRID